MKTFLALLQPGPRTTILDIGGTADFWTGIDLDVTLLNTEKPASESTDRKYIEADARDISPTLTARFRSLSRTR